MTKKKKCYIQTLRALLVPGTVCLEIYAKKTKHISVSCQQKVGKNHNKMTANKPYGNVAKVKYLGNTLKECGPFTC